MRFEFYHSGLADVPKLSVDGTVDNSLHFSHWQGNTTPPEVKADTSTEIALNLVSAPNKDELTRGIELVTNNHFDTDGVLSVWTVLTGDRAVDLRDKLVPAAEAGDFSEFTTEAAVRASIVIQGTDQPIPDDEPGSPIASQLAGENVADEARAYDLVLPEVEKILTRTNDYENLWRDPWTRIAAAIESFERGSSKVTELPNGLSLITLAPEAFNPAGFDPTRHVVPYTAISRYARGQLFLIGTPMKNGWAYRIDYPYYSWAETVVRPKIERHDFAGWLIQLNELENGIGQWTVDKGELSSAIKFLGNDAKLAASTLKPDDVANLLDAFLSSPAQVFAGRHK
jgi:hypothetical protein